MSAEWLPAAEAPADAFALAVIIRFECCHKGARGVHVASRVQGHWVMDINHDVEIEMFLPLPELPAILFSKGAA